MPQVKNYPQLSDLCIVYECFCIVTAELSCDRDCLAYKVEDIYYMALQGKMFADPWNRKFVDGAYVGT